MLDFDRIILASQSPRRRELLARLGLNFEIMPAQGQEESEQTDPGAYVEELARSKAEEIADRLAGAEGKTDQGRTLILGADTVVAKEGQILGKPGDEAEAIRMLTLLSGSTHQVTTGVCLLLLEGGRRQVKSFHELTQVSFAAMSQEEIINYVRTGDPMDKAGAYGIQSGAARFVTGIRGDYNNVVGLPIARLY